MKIRNMKRLREFKMSENELRSNCNKIQTFKRIYESNKKGKKNNENDKIVIFSNSQNRHIFSEIPADVFEYLNSIGIFNENIFDTKNGTVRLNCYYELMETVKYLIEIIELDLLKSYLENENLDYQEFDIE